MSNSDPSNKVLAAHLERCAYVYVRQSSYYQVEHNLESQRRQYNMRTWALELGWPEERIVVVDEDQGRSGAVAGMRCHRLRTVISVATGQQRCVHLACRSETIQNYSQNRSSDFLNSQRSSVH